VTWSPAKQRGVGEPGDDDQDSYQEDASWPLEVRSWLPGDRIRLRGGSRKLKRLFGDRRIPLSERGRIPVLSDAGGRVLWVWGMAKARLADPSSDERERAPLTIAIEEQ
jgi:tRNA(Ile)-lysidine synthase